MRSTVAFMSAILVVASPLWAGSSVPSTDQMKNAVLEVLRQEGVEPSSAAQLADKVVDRLQVEPAALTPTRLREKEGPLLPANWKDALAKDAPAQESPVREGPIAKGREKQYPENLANFVVQETEDAGRMVILKHLKEIEDEGRMSDAIATDDYWQQIFASQGYGDIYDASRKLLKTALRAGLKPYREGRALNAQEFARLAMEALQPPAKVASVPNNLVQP